MGAMERKRPPTIKGRGKVGRTARSRIRPFPLCIIALSRNASCLHLSFNYSQSAFFGQGQQGLFTCAKHLFVAARDGGGHDKKEGLRPLVLGGEPGRSKLAEPSEKAYSALPALHQEERL